MRPKVLYIPAWYPCSFFKEQIDVMRNDCEIRILKGSVQKIGLRRGLKYLLNKDEKIKFECNNDIPSVEVCYIQRLPKKYFTKQLNDVSNKIGDYIVYLFSGVKPDVIHIQSISDIAVFVAHWAKANNIKVVLTEHILFVRHEITEFSRLRESLYNTVNHVLCVSNYVYRNLLTSGFHPKKISTIGNLVNDKFLDVEVSQERNGKILFVANHYHDKGLEILLQVVGKLKVFGNIVVDVVGLDQSSMYNSRTTMATEIASRGVSNNINLLGIVDHNELLKMYVNYSVLLSTSISETFGLAVAESLMYGTPVVCTDSGGIRDFVNEKNGIIVPINDVDAIVSALLRILNKEVVLDNYSSQISEHYGYDAFRKKTSSVY